MPHLSPITPHLILCPGEAQGQVLALSEPVSFWGGFDPNTGAILENGHPQQGLRLKGKFVLMERGKGSSGTPAGVTESIRIGSGPAGMILLEPDANIATGALVARQLYGLSCPVLVLTAAHFAAASRATTLIFREDRLFVGEEG